MSKKIILNLSFDGTGNNKVNDRQNGSHTNVARLHDTLHADYRFNISRIDPVKPDVNGTSDPGKVHKGAEGNLSLFNAFFNYSATGADPLESNPLSGSEQQQVRPPDIPDNAPLVMNLYLNGVGSRGDGSLADRIEGGTGLGMEARVDNMINAVSIIRSTYGDDVEIEINGVSFSRGSAEAKEFLNRLDAQYSELHAHVNTFVLYDPVFAVGVPPMTDNLAGYNNNCPTGPATSDAHLVEIYAGDEHRKTFDLGNYSDSRVEYLVSPGAHSQVGGGYLNDILAAGPLAMGMNSFIGSGQHFDEIPIDDQVRMALYNEVIENPYVVRALVTDSRLASSDLLHPGTDAFPLELPQDYEFDNPGNGREVRNPAADEEHGALLDAIADSDSSVDDIVAMHHAPVPLPVELPYGLQNLVNAFGERISALSFTEGDPDTVAVFLSHFQEAYADLAEQTGWPHLTGDTVSPEQGTYADTLLADTQAISGRIGILEETTGQEQAEQELRDQVYREEMVHGAELDTQREVVDLRDAIDSGDGVRIGEEALGYISALDDYRDTLAGGENGGFLNPSQEAALDGLEHSLGLGHAIAGGDTLEIAGNTVDLVRDIDHFAEAGGGEFLDSSDQGYMNLASAGLRLARALDSGDGWEIASSLVSVVEGVDTTIAGIDSGSGAVGGASSAVGLAVNLASLDDVLASGDGMQVAYTAASMISNGVNTYNALAGMADFTPITTGAAEIPVLGYAAAAMELVEGDAKDAAVTAASSYLMTCGPYGWAAAAVLQVANMLGVFGSDDPPSATVNFALAEDGRVTMEAHGDSEMIAAARGYGSMLTGVLQGYHDSGGRLVVDGTLPSLVVEAGSSPRICYTSEYGGSVVIGAGDPDRIGLDMYGALVARDRGDRLDEAVHLATDAGGNVDMGRVEAQMASLGFVRHGMTWTFGETTSRTGHVFGTGGPHGGGNANGPEGEHFEARDEDISSLPLSEEELPGQKVGRVLRTVSLNQNFAGAGATLLALGLGLDADRAVAAARPDLPVQASGGVATADRGRVQADHDALADPGPDPLAGSRDLLIQGTDDSAAPAAEVAMGGDGEVLHNFLASLRPGMVSGYGLEDFGLPPATVQAGGARPGYSSRPDPVPDPPASDRTAGFRDDSRFHAPAVHSTLQPATDGWPGNVEPVQPAGEHDAADMSGTGRPVPDPVQPQPDPVVVARGVEMTVDRDASLVFLPSALAGEQTTHGAPAYARAEDQPLLVRLGRAEHGTVTMDDHGAVRFVPEPGFTGTASFEYILEGPDGTTTTYRSGVLVRDPDDPPVLTDDHPSIGEGEIFFVDTLLANDTDPDGDRLHIDHFRGLDHGTLAMVDNRPAFVPEPGFTGELEFSYWVTDQDGGYPHMARASLTVTDRNLGVMTADDHFIILEDHSLTTTTYHLLANDREFDGEGFGITTVGDGVHGRVSMDADGTITFVPDPDYAGREAGFTYTTRDDSGHLSQGRAVIEVQNLRDAPRIIADSLDSIGSSGTVVLDSDLLARFVTDADGDPLRFDSISAVEGGHVEQRDGSLVFVAGPGGQGAFDYQVGDGHSGMVQGHLRFTLATTEQDGQGLDDSTGGAITADPSADGENSPPVAAGNPDGDTGPGTPAVYTVAGSLAGEAATSEDDTLPEPGPDRGDGGAGTATETGGGHGDVQDSGLTAGADMVHTLEDTPVTISVDSLLANDLVIAGEPVFLGLGDADHGRVSMDPDGAVTFVPEADYAGDRAGFVYTIGDGQGNMATARVSVGVENVNDAPVILLDRLSISEDMQVTFTSDEIARFVTDADHDPLSFSAVHIGHGGEFRLEDGVATLVPEQDFYGTTWFDYTVSDGHGGEAEGRMQVEIAPVNDLPRVAGQEVVMAEDGEISLAVDTLLAGATDVEDGTELRFTDITGSRYGDAWLDDDGMVHFLPDDDFFGTAWFAYGVRDSEGGIGTGRVEIQVTGENDAPVAGDDAHLAAWGNNGHDNVFDPALLLANDYDVDLDPLRVTALGQPVHGQVSLDGAGRIHYRAAAGHSVGVDRFSYTVDDGHGGRAEAVAQVDVRLNLEPDGYSERLESREDIILHIDPSELLANDSDLDGDRLFITGVGNAEHGTVSLLDDGTIRFAPELNYNTDHPGQAGFDYTISDGISEPVTCRALVDPAPVNDAPILRGEILRGAVEDNIFSFTPAQLLANDTDVEAASSSEDDTISLASVSGAGHGSLEWDAAGGRIIYTPQPDFNGTDTFSYRVTDSHGAVSEVSSDIVVQAVNDNPVVRYDQENGAETGIWNRYRISDLLRNDYDVDGDVLHISHARVSGGHGHARISGGFLEVMPDVGQHRLEVSYDVTDGHGGVTGSRLTLDHIREHNFAPVFTGMYQEDWGRWHAGELWFAFQAYDRNDNSYAWGTAGNGDIVSISAANVHGGNIACWPNDNSSFRFEGDVATGGCTLTATDRQGASGTIRINFSHFHGITGQYVYSPVVLDLDGDGVELVAMDQGVHFDWNRDGTAEATGWVAPDDGLLVYDLDQDHRVSGAGEVMLRELDPGAATDLEGLQVMDANHDGVFSGQDAAWQDFGVWRDANGNGVCEDNEFHRLEELGITAIELTSDNREELVAGNTVHGHTVYHLEDGSTAEAGDVALRGEEIRFVRLEEGNAAGGDITVNAENSGENTAPGEEPAPDREQGTDAGSLAAPGDDGSSATESSVAENDGGDVDGGRGPVPEVPDGAPVAAGPAGEAGPQPGAGEVPVLDPAEVDRLAHQLQSDVAAGPAAGEPMPVMDADVCSVDLHPGVAVHDDILPADDTPDDLLAIA